MFHLHKSTNGQYYFNLKAANGETIATSEMYTSKGNAENGIVSIITTVCEMVENDELTRLVIDHTTKK
jgi:uncharacterized protein YegP (UPF0339 family)